MSTKPSLLVLASLTLLSGASALLSGCGAIDRTDGELALASYRANGNEAFVNRDYERASEEYAKYIEIMPNVADVRYRMALSQINLGRVGSAVVNFRVAYDIRPDNRDYAVGLADALVEAGRDDDMNEFIRDLTDSAVTSDDYITVGRVAQIGGLHDEALRAFQLAERISGTESAEPHRNLAGFYRTIGDEANETRHWRMVLSFDVEDAEANARLKDLGHIPGPSLAIQPTIDG